MGKRCICEICTCGRHRCPHRPKPTRTQGPCTLSEYANKYKGYPISRRETFKPAPEMVKSLGPMAGNTTHKSDFISHPVKRIQVRHGDEYAPIAGNIDLLTTYHRDFIEKRGERAKTARLNPKLVMLGPFQGTPTYKSDFRNWEMPKREVLQDNRAYKPPTEAFTGTTTFQLDYAPKQIRKTVSFKPSDEGFKSDTPFDDRTMHKTAFIHHPRQAPPVRERETYKRNPNKFDGLTTFRKDYTGPFAPRAESVKPANIPMSSDQPFDDTTTFKVDYKKWDLNKPEVRSSEPWMAPTGKMETNTTSRIAYVPHQTQPVSHRRPATVGKIDTSAFDDRTNYKADFQKWNVKRELAIDPSRVPYGRPTVPFDGLSNYMAHYVPKPIAPPQPFAPERGGFQSDTPFDDRTLYKIAYTPKEMEICPATDLPSFGYQFQEYNTRGHQVFTKPNGNGIGMAPVMQPTISNSNPSVISQEALPLA